MDFLFMDASQTGEKYILIIRDDFSSYCWLYAIFSATSAAAVDALTLWIGSFGYMQWIVTDQGTHFVNSLMKGLTSSLHIAHHLVTPYSPLSNGSVERICREVIRSCRVIFVI